MYTYKYKIMTVVSVLVQLSCRSVHVLHSAFTKGWVDSCAFNSTACLENMDTCCAMCSSTQVRSVTVISAAK